MTARPEMTAQEAREGIRALEPQIDRYAQLVVKTGVNVKPGQELVIQAPVDASAFVRLLSSTAIRRVPAM